MFYLADGNGKIQAVADFKFDENAVYTEEEIVQTYDGRWVFAEDTQTEEYKALERAYLNERLVLARASALKEELAKIKEDIEQETFGLVRSDYAEKKARACEIVNELRVLEGKEPREISV